MPLLELQHITRSFAAQNAVDDVSLSIESGEFFTLLGPSGCGKTTLLRMIGGFDTPNQGSMRLDGQDLLLLPPERRPIRTVFQNYALFPHMTVGQNIAFPLKMAGADPAAIKPQIEAALEGVRLAGFASRYPSELSGGQRQRVSIARALITKPRLLLLDEPLAALDAKLREQMQLELISLQKSVGITFIYVTHDQHEALALSDRIAVMNKGRVEQQGNPASIYAHPVSRFVADFIGSCNLLDGEVELPDAAHTMLRVPKLGQIGMPLQAGLRGGQRGTVAVRPEEIELLREARPDPGLNQFPGHVETVLYRGEVSLLTVRVSPEVTLTALIANSTKTHREFSEGQDVVASWPHAATTFLID